jgi:protein-S-isoprenylcysteine O-methyltransferase Ste14
MTDLWICIGICTLIWVFNIICIIHAIREKISCELYMHIGLAVFLSVLVMELTVGNDGAWKRFDIKWLRITGFVLYVPSAMLIAASMIALKHIGKSKGSDFTQTTTFIDKGLYGHIRQPMTFGLAIWSLALIFVFQSVPAIILCTIALICFRIAAFKESEYNIRKFGEDYRKYMKKVPMWNFLRHYKDNL